MGEPDKEWKDKIAEKLVQEKQQKSDLQFKAKKLEEARKKEMAKRQKQLEEAKKQMEEAKQKELEEAKKKDEEANKTEEEKKPSDEEKKAEDDKKDDKMEVDQTKEKEDEKKDEDADMEDDNEEPPKVELTEEEKAQVFHVHQTKDLSDQTMNLFMRKFGVPTKAEGFDKISYAWQEGDAALAYLKNKVQEKKVLARLDALQPGEWFREKFGAWTKQISEWQTKQAEWQAKQATTKKDKKEGEEDGEEEETKGVDIFSVNDVTDTGSGAPLFSNFQQEDWKLMELRYEMYLLSQGFKKDVDDAEHPGIHESLLVYYYGKYLKKGITVKYYGKESNKEMLDLVKDSMSVSDKEMVATQLAEDVETPELFVKLTEESRRERQRRIDAGDETARLKFSPLLYKPQPVQQVAPMMQVQQGEEQMAMQLQQGDQFQQKGGWQPKGKGWGKGWGKSYGKSWGK